MTDVTSFETTKKLVEAGFPRSENWGTQYYISETADIKNTIGRKLSYVITGNGNSKTIRASSAADILKELGHEFELSYSSKTETWRCYKNGLDGIENKNAAEAVAEMYLKVNS